MVGGGDGALGVSASSAMIGACISARFADVRRVGRVGDGITLLARWIPLSAPTFFLICPSPAMPSRHACRLWSVDAVGRLFKPFPRQTPTVHIA